MTQDPLFRISLSLNNPEVVVSPAVHEVNKLLGRLVRSLADSTKPFVRWMDGSCVETPEQRVGNEDDEPVIFTFYWDVAANPQIIKTMLMLNNSIQKTMSSVNRYVESWKNQQSLWKVDKASMLDKFAVKGPTNGQFEEKLAKYDKLATEMYTQAKNHDIYFIRISCHSIATSIRDECLGWVAAICKVMRNIDLARLQELNDLILDYKDGLHHTPDTLDELKVRSDPTPLVKPHGSLRQSQGPRGCAWRAACVR